MRNIGGPRATLMNIELAKYRTDPSKASWELPPWGHPLSMGVMPLFLSHAERLFPVGTAFTTGKGVTFAISAAHNIREVFRYEQRLGHLITERTLPEAITLREVGFYILYQRWHDASESTIDFALWPLENFNGAPPTDIVFGFPQFQTDWPTLDMKLGIDLPVHGERVWSVGYTDIECAPEGIELAAVQSGTFDWRSHYAHHFMVVEGHVDRIFTQRFASGFIDGPCFTFDAEIAHGLSGGPIISADTGFVRGINSAGATSYFGKPMSIGSLLYPLLLVSIDSGVQLGPARINSRQSILNWVAMGTIGTDGGEKRLGFTPVGDSLVACPTMPKEMSGFVHDDFAGYQAGRTATCQTGDIHRLRVAEED